jgi:hypothetical protein
MARPLPSGKQSVNLAEPGVRVSKIRRDPPPKLKEIVVRDRDEQDRRMVVIGVATFTLALLVILLAIASYTGWSPRQYTVYF